MSVPAVAGYEIIAPLGEGGMGRVFQARDLRLDRVVALKFLSSSLARDAAARTRFVREARLAASVEHPNVCSIFEIGEDESGDPFIAMSFCPGPTLAERLAEGPLPVDECLRVADEVSEALEAAHARGITHRDIKPANISFAEGGALKVLDFGIASLRSGSDLTSDWDVVGTVAYMAPEQLQGTTVDERSDVWGLGVVLYECVTGIHPFRAPYDQATIYNVLNVDPAPILELKPEINAGFQRLIGRCLERDPGQRFASMADLRAALNEVASLDPGEADASPTVLEFSGNLPGRSRTFVGRSNLGSLLQELIESEGPTKAALVSGESGIGKSELVLNTLRATAAGGTRVLIGRCVFNEGVLPYHPFVTALKQGFGVDNLDLSSNLEQLASQFGRDLRSRLPYLHAFFSASDDSAGVLNREQLWDSVLSFYRALASEQRRLVIVVDDLQWADESTLAFFSFLVRSTTSDPIRLIGIYRLDAAPSRGATSHEHLVESLRQLRIEGTVTEISVKRLERDESELLVKALFDDQPVADEVVDAVFEKTSGHPLFVSEMISLVKQDGIVERVGGLWRLASSAERLDVLPQRVQDVILQRLSTLAQDDRELLEVASIEGDHFTSETLAHCLGWNRITLLKRLQVLETQFRIIRHLDRGYRFDHSLIRQTLYDSILPELRSEYHRMIAEQLEGRHADDADFASTIATHLIASGQREQAIPYLEKSASRARSVYAMNQAHASYIELDSILRESPDPDMTLRLSVESGLGETYYLMGRVDESMKHLVWARKLAEELGDDSTGFEATRKLALCYRLKGDLDTAMRLATEALDLSDGHDAQDSTLIKARLTLSDVCASQGDYTRAIEHAAEALTLSDARGDRSGKSIAQSSLGFIYWHMGEIQQSMQYFLAAQATQRAIGDKPGLASTLNFLAMAIWKLARYEEALASASESVEIKRQINLQRAIPGSLNILGDVNRDLFQVEKALDLHLQSLSMAESHGNKGGMCDNLRDIGADHLVAGNVPKAAEYFRQALELAETAGIRWYQTRSHIGLAEASIAEGALNDAAQQAAVGYALAEEIGARELLVEAKWTLARAGGDEAAAVDLLESALDEAGELNLNTLKWQIELDLAELLNRTGRAEQASLHYTDAAATVQAIADRLTNRDLRRHFVTADRVSYCLGKTATQSS